MDEKDLELQKLRSNITELQEENLKKLKDALADFAMAIHKEM